MPTVKPIIEVAELATQIYVPRGKADTELEWFFTMAESDMGARSAFVASLARVLPDEPGDNTIEERVDAAYAQRTLLRWLQEVGDHDAGVLKAAYMARPWPLMLREELGRLTGVVVRIRSAEIGLPDDDRALDALEQRTANRLNEALANGAPLIERLQQQASPLLKRAFEAYVRERGGREAPVLRGIS